jgi:hypothetical protein
MRTEVFFGTSWTDWALIVAGMHPSELSGIEVAHWVGVRLAAAYADGRRPKFSTMLITELFPQDTAASREYEWKQRSGAAGRRRPKGDASEDHINYRNLVRDNAGNPVEPAQSKQAMRLNANRNFPVPGMPRSSLWRDPAHPGPVLPDGKTRLQQLLHDPRYAGTEPGPLLSEIDELLRIIEFLKPVRIASLHGKSWKNGDPAQKTKDAPGVFVDPRYVFDPAKCGGDTNDCKFNKLLDPAFTRSAKTSDKASKSAEGQTEDDPLCLELARASERLGAQVPGNHLTKPPPVLHYAQDMVPLGFSLGDWAPVDVVTQGGEPGTRKGVPVITVEPFKYYESGAFVGGKLVVDPETCQVDLKALGAAAATVVESQRVTGLTQIMALRLAWTLDHLQFLDTARAKKLRAHADALLEVFLEVPAK